MLRGIRGFEGFDSCILLLENEARPNNALANEGLPGFVMDVVTSTTSPYSRSRNHC